MAPEEPSRLSIKLAESVVILKFLVDAYPKAELMPSDPIRRARVRFFIEAVTNKYVPACMAWILDRESQAAKNLLKGIVFFKGLLPDAGEYTIGDGYAITGACITPFIHPLHLCIEQIIPGGKWSKVQ